MSVPSTFVYGTTQKWDRMLRWRARWEERESRLQLRLLGIELEQIRNLETSVHRLMLVAEVEDLLREASAGHSEPRPDAVRRLRDEVEAESIRAVLNSMQN